ncbi:aspartate aminotransferase family protein [Burkholderia sp. FERM BP-3421]|jgi:glutamate/tyrosine decarboxylase-like PLP-dependent enzyme|uniref:pyridoxal phosphate-dependent decarboxylase family protein n=1 Tax=Burkholderia sp. FERM BP-3421 TaxID=1494466 RepID=UPI0023601AE8|nr:aspartate aminotransferase family protein [Burkholderia sp. FERM BP-3421]WDD92434.1 aspartate aminotransferase family protein [Burkholderia sp. FERM BP-3421]
MNKPTTWLPGANPEHVRQRLGEFRRLDWDHRGGRLPLHCYFANEEVDGLADDAYRMFAHANALAPQAFPSCHAMEAEIVSMGLSLFGGGDGGAGNVTSGGTESIILAVKAARDKARAERPMRRPNIVIPSSAHPAFDKAAQLLDLDVTRVPVAADYRSDVSATAAALNADTVLMVGSAPSLPYGLFDRIAALSELALQRGIWLHVDACIGGLLAPFVREIGRHVPAFDFRLEGVRSISADLHKFGYASKGASLMLYRHTADHRFQISRFSAWPKGEYVTPTLAGTRSGGPIASAWAVMHFLGQDGYCALAERLMRLRDRYLSGFDRLPELMVLGEPELSVLSVTAPRMDIFAIAEHMRRRGWYMSMVANPPAIQQTVNLVHEPVADRYFDDLRETIAGLSAGDAQPMHAPRQVVTY